MRRHAANCPINSAPATVHVMPSTSEQTAQRSERRVVITGYGAVTDLGLDAQTTLDAMREGRSGVTPIADDILEGGADKLNVRVAGQAHGFNAEDYLDKVAARKLDRCTQLGVAASIQAFKHSGIEMDRENPERCGVVVGSGIGGIATIEAGCDVLRERGANRINPFTVPRLMVNAVTGNTSILFNLQGPASAHATACASAGHAMADAAGYIRRGHADVMLAGGTEAAVTPLCLGAFATMKALSNYTGDASKASRPFDVDRDGFVLAEGAAMYILESEEHAKARGATIHAVFSGAANSSDASHITAPDPEGRGASRSMRWALEDAGLDPTEIEYVNAHGTSTPLGDSAEVAAVLGVFGDHARKSTRGKLLMSSTKSMHGHCLGASGAIETLACIHAVRDGVICPTINLENPDESFDIDLVAHEGRERRVRYAMNNTFGFGGHNVTMIIGRYDG